MTVPVYDVSIATDSDLVTLLFHVYTGIVYVVKLPVGQRHVCVLARRACSCDGDRAFSARPRIVSSKSKMVGIF